MSEPTVQSWATLRPTRVLHLVPQLRLGGMEQGVVKLLNGLPRERIISGVCSFEAITDSIRDSLDPQVPVHLLGRRAGNDPLLVWRLMHLLRRVRPDVVHSHSWGTLCEGYVAARLARIRHFVHGEHGTMELRARNIRVQRWVWNHSDRVLSVSSKLAERMVRQIGVPQTRVRVIRNGADLAKFGAVPRVHARLALDIPDGTFVIGTIGRLVPVKDHETFLAMLADLKHTGTECLALIAGDGPLRSDLEQRAHALGLESSLRFLGNRTDIDRVLAALDVFVLTSVSEGLPNTILEAMAAGLPVVSTDVGGVDELVDAGRTGFLSAPKDAGALATAVSMLARDAERRRRMGADGQAKARSEYGLQRMLDEYERFYLELVGRAMSPRPEGEAERSRRCAELLAE